MLQIKPKTLYRLFIFFGCIWVFSAVYVFFEKVNTESIFYTLLGSFVIFVGWKNLKDTRNTERLRKCGKYVRANIDQVSLVNKFFYQKRYIIKAHWEDAVAKTMHNFKSVPFLLTDGFTVNMDEGVDVYFDTMNPKKYFMNIFSSIK